MIKALLFLLLWIGTNTSPVITACGPRIDFEIWAGEGVTTWPVLGGMVSDPHDPDKFIISFMQMRKDAEGFIESQQYNQGSDGTIYEIINGSPVEKGTAAGILMPTSPLFRMARDMNNIRPPPR